jgi:hypothetical protein
MDQPLDILRILAKGGVQWVSSAKDLEAAKVFIKAASKEEPGDFLLLNTYTGWQTEIKADPAA